MILSAVLSSYSIITNWNVEFTKVAVGHVFVKQKNMELFFIVFSKAWAPIESVAGL